MKKENVRKPPIIEGLEEFGKGFKKSWYGLFYFFTGKFYCSHCEEKVGLDKNWHIVWGDRVCEKCFRKHRSR
ncbi:hypothetical protein [Priestia megaterium]|uniref:hypothetical protein n=1 Tax=Priestia megaterium TaxID=1404 RepID=UPI000BF8B881|nr:hypothetical protein [Priestia megaterium]PFW43774.1 hypothetical protein COL17_26565 [Priestia megaterium]